MADVRQQSPKETSLKLGACNAVRERILVETTSERRSPINEMDEEAPNAVENLRVPPEIVEQTDHEDTPDDLLPSRASGLRAACTSRRVARLVGRGAAAIAGRAAFHPVTCAGRHLAGPRTVAARHRGHSPVVSQQVARVDQWLSTHSTAKEPTRANSSLIGD